MVESKEQKLLSWIDKAAGDLQPFDIKTASNMNEIIQVCMQEEGVSLDPHIITNASSELVL